jgi:hypothetical protein
VPFGEDFDKLFENFIERRPRCSAAVLRYETVWDIAKWLRGQGFGTKVISVGDVFALEVLLGDQVLFTADVNAGDTIVYRGEANVSHVPGRDFRTTWERDICE